MKMDRLARVVEVEGTDLGVNPFEMFGASGGVVDLEVDALAVYQSASSIFFSDCPFDSESSPCIL